MSRNEADREDLMREATALVERIELEIPGANEPWVVGFRKNGAASIFAGQDLVLQFNVQNAMRRAYAEGRLVTSEDGSLFWLDRERNDAETILRRSPLSQAESESLLQSAQAVLDQLRSALKAGVEVAAAVPDESTVLQRIEQWLSAVVGPIAVARSPRVVDS